MPIIHGKDILSVANLQLVDVRVEDPVRETDAGRLIGVLFGELDVDFPDAAFEGSCFVCVVSLCIQ